MEALLTMLLVLVVYASAVDTGNNTSPMLPPLLIGLTVTAAHLLLIPFTGKSSQQGYSGDRETSPGKEYRIQMIRVKYKSCSM